MKRDARRFYLITSLLLFATQGWGTGGEIGNAYRAYSNALGEYSISYPANWQYIDFNQSVTFAESAQTRSENPASVSVIDRRIASIRDKKDLLKRIQTLHPEVRWKETEISGRQGYTSDSEDYGMIYLLKANDQVLSIRFDSANKRPALKEIYSMIESLEIK